MDKRSTKILIGCILCTMMVLALFLIVFRFSQLSCELVSLDPVQLASTQLAAFSKDSKPVRSHDETIIMKISAYLEYNVQPDASESPPPLPPMPAQPQQQQPVGPLSKSSGPQLNQPIGLHQNSHTNFTNGNANFNATTTGSFGQQSANTFGSQANNNKQGARSSGVGPAPSIPQIGFPSQQQNVNSTNFAQQQPLKPSQNNWDKSNQMQQQPKHHSGKAEKRYLPLELRSIEARNLMDGQKHKYILNFNCTKINMVLVHQNNQVYVESMNLELRPRSQKEATCKFELPPQGAFTVADSSNLWQGAAQVQGPLGNGNGPQATGQVQQQATNVGGGFIQTSGNNTGGIGGPNANNRHSSSSSSSHSTKEYPHFAHYYCNKPLRYLCYHYNPKSGPSQSNGLLLATLHINGIEFETSTSWMGKHKKVKSDFKSKRSECNIA